MITISNWLLNCYVFHVNVLERHIKILVLRSCLSKNSISKNSIILVANHFIALLGSVVTAMLLHLTLDVLSGELDSIVFK